MTTRRSRPRPRLITAPVLFVAFFAALGFGIAFAQFDSTAKAPLPLLQAPEGAQWDVQVHSREATKSNDGLSSMQAEHGDDCSGPPATHETHTYEGAVFICNNHVMTAINEEGYGEVVLTPAQILDFSEGEGTVTWELSTVRSSLRDWPDVWITPWDQNLTLPFDSGEVDQQGIPRTGIHINLNDSQNVWMLTTIQNGEQSTELDSRYGTPAFNDGITPGTNEAATRQAFRLTVSRTHLKLERLESATAPAAVYFDGDVTDLGFSSGVVQFAHHSYNPTKGDGCGDVCKPATWHWDELQVSPGRAFTIIKTHTRALFKDDSVVFDSPAPDNSWLRFSALGSIQYSLNGGKDWQKAKKQAFIGHAEHQSPYFISIPAGTQSVQIKFGDDDWYKGPFVAQDFAIWSTGAAKP